MLQPQIGLLYWSLMTDQHRVRPRRRWEDYIEMHEMHLKRREWIGAQLAQSCTPMNMVMKEGQ